MSFYTNSFGWDAATQIWTNPAHPEEYIILSCVGGIIGQGSDTDLRDFTEMDEFNNLPQGVTTINQRYKNLAHVKQTLIDDYLILYYM